MNSLTQNQLLLIKVARYISNYPIRSNVMLCASMPAPYYWTLKQDLILIYALAQEGFNNLKAAKKEIASKTYINGKAIPQSILPKDDWINNRRDLLIYEINESLIPKNFEPEFFEITQSNQFYQFYSGLFDKFDKNDFTDDECSKIITKYQIKKLLYFIANFGFKFITKDNISKDADSVLKCYLKIIEEIKEKSKMFFVSIFTIQQFVCYLLIKCKSFIGELDYSPDVLIKIIELTKKKGVSCDYDKLVSSIPNSVIYFISTRLLFFQKLREVLYTIKHNEIELPKILEKSNFKWEEAPEWWSYEQDQFLLQFTYKYGLLHAIDLFRKIKSKNAKVDYPIFQQNLQELKNFERRNFPFQYPAQVELGEFKFLYDIEIRIERIRQLLNILSANIGENQNNRNSNVSIPSSPTSIQNTDQNEINEDKIHDPIPIPSQEKSPVIQEPNQANNKDTNSESNHQIKISQLLNNENQNQPIIKNTNLEKDQKQNATPISNQAQSLLSQSDQDQTKIKNAPVLQNQTQSSIFASNQSQIKSNSTQNQTPNSSENPNRSQTLFSKPDQHQTQAKSSPVLQSPNRNQATTIDSNQAQNKAQTTATQSIQSPKPVSNPLQTQNHTQTPVDNPTQNQDNKSNPTQNKTLNAAQTQNQTLFTKSNQTQSQVKSPILQSSPQTSHQAPTTSQIQAHVQSTNPNLNSTPKESTASPKLNNPNSSPKVPLFASQSTGKTTQQASIPSPKPVGGYDLTEAEINEAYKKAKEIYNSIPKNHIEMMRKDIDDPFYKMLANTPRDQILAAFPISQPMTNFPIGIDDSLIPELEQKTLNSLNQVSPKPVQDTVNRTVFVNSKEYQQIQEMQHRQLQERIIQQQRIQQQQQQQRLQQQQSQERLLQQQQQQQQQQRLQQQQSQERLLQQQQQQQRLQQQLLQQQQKQQQQQQQQNQYNSSFYSNVSAHPQVVQIPVQAVIKQVSQISPQSSLQQNVRQQQLSQQSSSSSLQQAARQQQQQQQLSQQSSSSLQQAARQQQQQQQLSQQSSSSSLQQAARQQQQQQQNQSPSSLFKQVANKEPQYKLRNQAPQLVKNAAQQENEKQQKTQQIQSPPPPQQQQQQQPKANEETIPINLENSDFTIARIPKNSSYNVIITKDGQKKFTPSCTIQDEGNGEPNSLAVSLTATIPSPGKSKFKIKWASYDSNGSEQSASVIKNSDFNTAFKLLKSSIDILTSQTKNEIPKITDKTPLQFFKIKMCVSAEELLEHMSYI